MNRERLLNVAKALRESRSPRDFTMSVYGNKECGTPACALGHYASRRDLQRTFVLVTDESDQEGMWVNTNDGSYASYSSEAVCQHFGIECDQAFNLFSAIGCGGAKTPKQAARFIERFVARGGSK